MQARKLSIACPTCGSGEVFYSCTPNCCFNHVCAECGTTFEPETRLAGGTASRILPPDPLPEAADPTVACVRCDSTAVYALEGDLLVCGKCMSLLKLEITEVAPDGAARS